MDNSDRRTGVGDPRSGGGWSSRGKPSLGDVGRRKGEWSGETLGLGSIGSKVVFVHRYKRGRGFEK